MPLVEPPAGEPDPLAFVDQQLHPGAAPVREELGVMRARLAEDSQHLGEERVHAGAHVERRHRQPQGVDPEHPSHSRSQATQAAAEDAGQSTVTVTAPLRSSSRMGVSRLGESCTGTKLPNGSDAATRNGRQDNSGGSMPRSRIQHRSWLALIPLARAMPATEAPGSLQASIRDRLNSYEWVRRVRRGWVTFMKVSTVVRSGHYV